MAYPLSKEEMGVSGGPDFLLKSVFSDGSSQQATLYKLKDVDLDWEMGRRGFLFTFAAAVSMMSACSPSVEPEDKSPLGKSRSSPRNTVKKTSSGQGVAEKEAERSPEPSGTIEECGRDIRAHSKGINTLSFSPDGKMLASASTNGEIKLWEMPSGTLVKTLAEKTNSAASVAFSADGKILAGGSVKEGIRFWEIPSCDKAGSIKKDTGRVRSLQFDPWGTIIASSSGKGTIQLWLVPDGKLVNTFRPGGSVDDIAFSPDGIILASPSRDHAIELWEMSSGKVTDRLSGHTDRVAALAFHPEGLFLASGSRDKSIRIWDITQGGDTKTLWLHSGRVSDVAFCPDGQRLASASEDKTVIIWRIPSGDFVMRLEGHETAVMSIAFSPDNTLLASGSRDGKVILWQMPPGEFLTCLFDAAALKKGKEAGQYTFKNRYGGTTTRTLPCGSPLPPGTICTCNCVPGTYAIPFTGSRGGTICTCDKICTCVPIK